MALAQKEELTPEQRLQKLYSLEHEMLKKTLTLEVAQQKEVVKVALSIAKSSYGISDVRSLQEMLGVKVDGILGPKTLLALFKRLQEDNKNKELVQLRSAVYPHLREVSLWVPLELLRSFGADNIKELQKGLVADYAGKKLKVDGVFGKRTLYAALVKSTGMDENIAKAVPVSIHEFPYRSITDEKSGKTVKIVESYSLEKNIKGTREGKKPQYIILHHTATNTREEAIAIMNDDKNKTSAHYIIDKDGTIYAEVREELKAEHARGWNQRSIGIEIVSPGDGTYTEAQYASLRALLKDITTRHNIPYDNRHIIGHFEVSEQKYDPYGLNWGQLGLEEPSKVGELVARKTAAEKQRKKRA